MDNLRTYTVCPLGRGNLKEMMIHVSWESGIALLSGMLRQLEQLVVYANRKPVSLILRMPLGFGLPHLVSMLEIYVRPELGRRDDLLDELSCPGRKSQAPIPQNLYSESIIKSIDDVFLADLEVSPETQEVQ